MAALPEDPVSSLGFWQAREKFSGRKSFGFFACNSCGTSSWVSAHGFKSYKQACKKCNQYSLPVYLWVNQEDRKAGGDRDDKKKPHKSGLCEACARGVCTR